MLVSMDSPVFIVATSVAILLLTFLYRALSNPLRSLPGPWYSIFTRLPLKIAIISGRRIFHVHDLHAKYGPIVRIAPNEVAVASTAGLSQIHRANSPFYKTEWYHELTAQAGRYNVFAMTDPKAHTVRRKLMARPFSRSFLLLHWHDEIREFTRKGVRRMKEVAAQQGGELDVLRWWGFMAMDVAGRIMFGHGFQNLERGIVSDTMRIITRSMIARGVGVELPWIVSLGKALRTVLPIQSIQEMFRPTDILYELASNYLQSVKASSTSSNIFSNIAAEGEKGEKLEMEDVQLESSGMIVAATDTTAVTLTYLTWAVLSLPELQKALEFEVAALPEEYGDTDLEKLPLLNAVIAETLRLYGAAPTGMPRAVPPGGAHLNDHFVPAGTTVVTQAYTYHRDPKLFPEPNEFLPSRWLNDEISPEAKKAFHPFGAGSRICLGIHIAYMELRLASAEFFRECKGARLGRSVKEETMEMLDYFLVTPRGHQCEIVLS
ncbi:hypothetical protein Q7P37_007129 [Cladosporium fusiforme]